MRKFLSGILSLLLLMGLLPAAYAEEPALGVTYEIFVASFQDSGGDGIGDLQGIIDRLEKGIMEAGPVTKLLLDNDDPESLLRRVMKDFELEILETVPVEYRCYCSRERMAAALVSLGRKQLTELAEDPNGIELTCQFCDSRQRFTPEEIRELLEKASEA